VRFAAFAALLLGCGRLNFNEQAVADADVDSPSTDGQIDAATIAVCGNGICEGALGEMCGMCGGDCAVKTVVCGNGECQTGEDGTTCYADCGPPTWPWTQEETSLLNAVNAARTGGVTCPGDAMPRTAAAFTATTAMTVGVREMAWEHVHQQFSSPNGTSCNGRTFIEREQTYGGNGGLSVYGNVADATTAVNVWKADSTLCPILMTAKTEASTGVAHDNGIDSWIIWFK
jgi:hypothetical protein